MKFRLHLAIVPGLTAPELRIPNRTLGTGAMTWVEDVARLMEQRYRVPVRIRSLREQEAGAPLRVEVRLAEVPDPEVVAALLRGLAAVQQRSAPGPEPRGPAPRSGRRRLRPAAAAPDPEKAQYIWAATPLGTGEVLNRSRVNPEAAAPAGPALPAAPAPVPAQPGPAAPPPTAGPATPSGPPGPATPEPLPVTGGRSPAPVAGPGTRERQMIPVIPIRWIPPGNSPLYVFRRGSTPGAGGQPPGPHGPR